MARKYRRRGSKLSEIMEGLDWTINPETTREVIAVVLLLLGLIGILGIFSKAGSLGHFLFGVFFSLWGYFGFIIPFAVLASSFVAFFPKRFEVKPSMIVGGFMILIFLPGLFGGNGGLIGHGIGTLFTKLIGLYAGLLAMFVLTVASFLVTFNTTIKSLWYKFGSEENDQVKVNEPRASVFTTLRSREAAPAPKVSVLSVPKSTADQTWNFPSVELLENNSGKAQSGNIPKNVEIIQKSLKDFNIEVSMGDVNVGPTVTQYTLKPADGVKLNQITARTNDLALALAMHPIRIEAPIPGKAAVGIEVPNKVAAMVTLREVLESEEFKASKSNLTLALGRDVAGTAFVADLKKAPHLLIAGATGSGKSIGINGMILSLIYQNSPSDLRLIMVDPKRVEFTHYNGIPHLLCPVIFDADKTVSALRWAVAEMDRRFRLFQESGRRNIEAYNADPTQGHLPYIVIVIDELADLMAQAGNEVEAAIVRIAQMARAVGIHLLVATQRPSVDVITGLIKANIPSRIAFAVASQVDSRTIIDMAGAERLLGNGDMLYAGSEVAQSKRVQGAYVSDKDVDKLTEYLKKQSEPQYDETITAYRNNVQSGVSSDGGMGGDDDLYNEAKETVVMAGKASASLLQRRLRVGYARAARLLDMLEEEGVIGPPEGAKPRDVLIDATSLDHERNQVKMPLAQEAGSGFYRPMASSNGQAPVYEEEDK